MSAHFRQRVSERAPHVDPHWLARELRQAVLAGNTTFAVRIMDGRGNTGLYRLFMREGRYYAIVNDRTGAPVTFLRQSEVAAVKASIRGHATSVAAYCADRFCHELKRERSHIRKRKDMRGY